MQKEISDTRKQYNGFPETFKYAIVGIPQKVSGLSEDFYGTYHAFLSAYPDLRWKSKVPVVLYLHGSSGFNTGDLYRRYIVEEVGAVFFAPDSTQIRDRPGYTSPAQEQAYIKVHHIRLAEIDYALDRLKTLAFTDTGRLFLMGKSEGALAASIYRSKAFRGRIILSFSCESTYFYSDFKLGSQADEPILNIIGTDDPYFSKESGFNEGREVEGSGAVTLKGNKNAKVVLLPATGHDLTKNPYTKDEIISFLKRWTKS